MKHILEGPELSPPVIEYEEHEMQVTKGTFCGVIGQALAVATCPLRSGTCMWSHRATRVCKFTQKPLTAHEFAALVGLPPVDGAFVNILRASLKNKVYQEMSR